MTPNDAATPVESLLADPNCVEAIFGALESVIVVLGPDGRIRSMNRFGESMSGFSATEILGRTFASVFFAPEEVGLLRTALTRLQRGESPISFESSLVAKSGDRLAVRWSCSVPPRMALHESPMIFTGIQVPNAVEESDAVATRSSESSDLVIPSLSTSRALTNQNRDEEDFAGTNRRGAVRRPYAYYQRIAPVRDEQLPKLSHFYEALCHNISSKGFAFYAPGIPDYEELVVALGTGDRAIYLRALIMHTTLMSHDAFTYLVGCAYSGRVDNLEE